MLLKFGFLKDFASKLKRNFINVKAINGYICPTNMTEKVLSPLYDIINSQEAKELAKNNKVFFFCFNYSKLI